MNQLIIKRLGLQDYQPTWQAMRSFTHERTSLSPDELWLLEHPPVFTQGQSGKAEHILDAHNIPIVQSDRGGQVTYHGPGQLVIYCLLDIGRLGIHVRELVTRIEHSIIDLLAVFNISAESNPKAPGVYVQGAKIASIGLRVHKGRTYHGLSLNVDMDMTPFSFINPCGYQNQPMTTLSQLGVKSSISAVGERLAEILCQYFHTLPNIFNASS